MTLNYTSKTLNIGESFTLAAVISPENAANKTVTWSSGNTTVATVSTSGVVTANAPGTAVITVTTNSGGKTASCTVTVNPSIPSAVTLNQSSVSLTVGETIQLTATVSPSNATDKTVTWTSSNTSVATVNQSGLVTARAAGTATITVTTNSGGKTASCTVTVTDEYPEDSLLLSAADKTAVVGSEVTIPLTLTNNPGIASVGFEIAYDSTVFEYVDFNAEAIFPKSAVEINATQSGALIVSINDAVNHTGDGVLLQLTFRVLSTAQPGTYALALDIDSAPGIYGMYNESYAELTCAVRSGVITVRNVIRGDVDGSGSLNRADLVKMARYFARYQDAQDLDTLAADTDGDGRLTRADLVKMARYFARYISSLD